MSSPFVWIAVPLTVAAFLLTIKNEWVISVITNVTTTALVILAIFVPIDSVQTIGNFNFVITPTLNILGRQLTLSASEQPFLVIIYFASLLWFLGSHSGGVARRILPPGLIITALLVASLAVQPFLYAALFIEMAVLVAIPMLSTPSKKSGNGIQRFLINQTLALPFILFSGWLLAGVDANPGDVTLLFQTAIMLGMGFSILLAIFPFSNWMLSLMGEVHPFPAGFVLWVFPTTGLVFLTYFLERYAWLRTSAALPDILSMSGILMIVTGGFLAAFQKQLGRIFACVVMVETGFSLLSLSLIDQIGMSIFLALLLPRMLSMVLWIYSLSIIYKNTGGLSFQDIKGLGRSMPILAAGIILANLSLAGLPLLAGFPIRLALADALQATSPFVILWIFLGSFGLAIAAVRTLLIFVTWEDAKPAEVLETRNQKVILSIGILLLFLVGLFPQWASLASIWATILYNF